MRFVILCEGSDDLWFISYYLDKACGWEADRDKAVWKKYNLQPGKKQEVQYIQNGKNSGAIFAVAGQDRFQSKVCDILKINDYYPQDPITAIIIVRDCDDRNQESVANSMSEWFGKDVSLSNNTVSIVHKEIEEIDVNLNVLPVVIPFDEEGAIETLLLKSLEDEDKDGEYVAQHAREYIEEAKSNVSKYLSHDRLITKAKLSAAISITNPDHSTKLFGELMHKSDWEKSPQVQKHFEKILELIN